jgi:predicted O-linked N-acetylglucosamine transferase (SPINDLY family)
VSDSLQALMRRAADLFARGDGDGAAALLHEAVRRAPDDPDALANLGFLYRSTGHYVKALSVYERAAALDEADIIRVEIANCLVNLRRYGEARAAFDSLLATPQGRRAAASSYLMALLYDPAAAPQFIADEHRRLTANWRCDPPQPRARPRGKMLRVGYLTADFFGDHPVAQFLAPLIERHAARGDIVSIAYDARPKRDGTSARMEKVVAVKPIDALDDDAAAALIRADDIDLLVDLSGHTSGRRLAILGRRPAPVQASFIGYPSTTGYAAVDHLIGDGVLFPPGDETLYTERLARLPNAFLAFAPPPSMPAPKPARKEGPVVFGSLNHLPKLNDGVIALWADVLKAAPGAQLLLQCAAFAEPETRAESAQAFAAQGIGAGRLRLEGPQPFAEAIRRYAEIDIALDPFPYNGGTTTAHALHQGVPVVTLEGRYFCGRMGASLLAAAGRPEWIAKSREDYVRIAADLAARIARGDAPRADLLRSNARAPLFDIDRWAQDVEQLYRAMADAAFPL